MSPSVCNCNQCNQQRNGLPCNNNQFNFPAQQNPSNLCGGGFNSGNIMGIVGGNGVPSLHQLGPNPLGGTGLNSFHANGGGFGSNIINGNHMLSNDPINLMDGCPGGNGGVACSDCINGGNNGCNCNRNSNDCMMYGNCGQYGGSINGCRLRRRRNTLFADAASASTQRRKAQRTSNNSGAEHISNSASESRDSTVTKRKKESKNTKKRQRQNKLKPALRQKGKVVSSKSKANSSATGSH